MLKYSLVCIVSLCLLQFAHALPLQKRPASFSDKELKAHNQLVIKVIRQITHLATYTVRTGRLVLVNTVNELNALPKKSQALQANITRMSNFAKETKNMLLPGVKPNFEKSLGAMIKLGDILDDYDDMPEGEELTKTLKTAFEKSGLEKFNSDIEKRTIDFTIAFEKSFDAYLNVVSDKHKDPKLMAWFDKLKAEKDGEKKLDVFLEFFDIFN